MTCDTSWSLSPHVKGHCVTWQLLCSRVSTCVTLLHLSKRELCKCLSMTGMLTDVFFCTVMSWHVWCHMFLLLTHQSTYLISTIVKCHPMLTLVNRCCIYACESMFVKTCHVSMCVICQAVPHQCMFMRGPSQPSLNCQLFPFINSNFLIQLPTTTYVYAQKLQLLLLP